MKRRVKKRGKGVSPLIATILLVGFTVSIVALTILWSRGYIEERAEKEEKLSSTKLACEQLKFTVTDAYQQGGQLSITLENKASERIDGFIFRIKGSAGVEPVEFRQRLEELGRKDIIMDNEDFDATAVGDISTVDIIPLLKAGKDTYIHCSSQSLETRMTR